MPFPTADNTASAAVPLVLLRAKQLRTNAAQYIAQCDASALRLHDVGASFMSTLLAPVKAEFAAAALVPGFYDELARQVPSFANAAAAQTAFEEAQAAINTMIVYIETNIPVDAQRRLLSLTVSNDGTGTLTQRTLGAGGPLNAFRAELVTFRDAFSA